MLWRPDIALKHSVRSERAALEKATIFEVLVCLFKEVAGLDVGWQESSG